MIQHVTIFNTFEILLLLMHLLERSNDRNSRNSGFYLR